MQSKTLLSLLAVTGAFLHAEMASAQAVPPSVRTPQADKTLGTQVSGNGNNFNITGGLNRGQTLFHSFKDFSIPTGGAANFNNPVGTRDIITRVTGNLFSDINGTLNSNGANFLLINPNGVVFGPNARLNVGKAFAASTASGVDLIDGQGRQITFGTKPGGDAPLLKINPNVFLNISRLNMGASVPNNPGIVNYGKLQTNNDSQYIGLIGGNVSLNGGKIIAPGGKVELGGLNQAGEIRFSFDKGLQFPASVERGNVSLVTGTSPSQIDVQSEDGGGSVEVFAKDIILQGKGTRISTGIEKGTGSPTATTGDIKLDATGNIKLSEAIIFNAVSPSGRVRKAGNIEVNTRNLFLTNNAELTSSIYGKGDAGNLKITATDNIFFDNKISVLSRIVEGGVGKGGNIEINTRNLSLTNGSRLTSSIFGKGDAGNVKITATDNISFDNSYIFSRVAEEGVGKGGNIEINTRNLSLTNGSRLISNANGKGDAGNVKITATGDISFDGLFSGVFSELAFGGVGKGGSIEINTRNLSLTNGARLRSSTNGKGDAGNVKIIATDNISFGNISFDGLFSSLVSSEVGFGGVGKGGNIEINTRNLSLTNGAELTSSANGKGDAGNVKITATDNISFDGRFSGISSNVGFGDVGKGGDIEINTRNLSLTNGAQLSSGTSGKGDAGNVKITATDNISFDGSFRGISSDVGFKGVGKGGNIEINTRNLSLTNGAQLQATTFGQGDAGNVKITATGDISFDGILSGISSDVNDAEVGKGGNIEINTRNLSLTNSARLSSGASEKGVAGNVKITATDNISFDSRSGISSGISGGFRLAGGGKGGNVGNVGKGGNIEINTRNLSLTNGAELRSSTNGEGDENAGNIFLNANTITLNQGKIFSTSTRSTGGDINITTKNYLLLRNDSLISTDSDSTRQNGNGGNISINSPLIVALPGNNDISANAIGGNGGRLDITSQGLFGIKYRPKGQESLFTNDITSSSTFGQSGTVNISTPGTDPGKDSTVLPTVPTDASNQIAQTCGASRENKFVVAGRGGIPSNANDPLTSDVVWQDARGTNSQSTASSATTDPTKLAPPATGLVFDGKGKATLIAAGTQGQPTGTSVVCPSVVRK